MYHFFYSQYTDCYQLTFSGIFCVFLQCACLAYVSAKLKVLFDAECCTSSRTSTWMRCRLTSVPCSQIVLTVLRGPTSAYSMSRVDSRKTPSSATEMLSTLQNVRSIMDIIDQFQVFILAVRWALDTWYHNCWKVILS